MLERNNGRAPRRAATLLAHFLFIVIIFVLPELVMMVAMPNRRIVAFYPGFYIKTLIYLLAFYINYYILVDKTLGSTSKRRIVRFVFWNLVILAVGVALCYLSSRVWFPSPWRGNRAATVGPSLRHMLKSASFIMRDGAMLILTIGLAVAMRLSVKWKDMEQQRQEMLAAQRSTELDNLKSQLNPHFLFNTLNTIYALVDVDPEDAKGAVHRLSGLLRYMLYENDGSVRLGQELGFIEDYVALMRLRLGSRPVFVDIEADEYADAMVPPLLFVPLIENAFKYGNTAEPARPISISVRVEGRHIVCRTANDFAPAAADGDKSASGIGLANLRRRLVLLYGSKASLRTSVEGQTYKSSLKIPINESYG